MLALTLDLLKLASAGVSAFMGILVLLRNPRMRLNQIFFILCMTVACWAFTIFEIRISADYEEAMTWLRISFFWPLPSAILLHFVLEFTGHQSFLERKWPYLMIYGPATVIAAYFFSSDFYSGLPVKETWGWIFKFPESLFS